MPKERKPFRLHLPWLASKRTKAQPQLPLPTKESSQPPSQPTTSAPIKRPAFRPAGIAPTQPPPPQSQPPAKVEPKSLHPSSSSLAPESTKTSTTTTKAAKPPSPSPATTESPKITSQPTSSSGATTKPPSPSSAVEDERKDTSKSTSSPSSTTTRPPKANSQTPSSPSSAATESQKDASQSAFSPSSATTKPPFSHAASESPKATSRIASDAMPILPSPKTTTELEPKPASLDNSQAIDQDSSSASLASTHTKESTTQTSLQEREKIQEISKDKGTYKEEPMQKTTIEAQGTRGDTEETCDVARKASRRKRKHETAGRKKTKSTTGYIGKKIKTVIPLQTMEENTGTSFPKPSLSLQEEQKEEAPQQREIKEDMSKLVVNLTTGPLFIEKPLTIVTVAGENRGATMQLSSEAPKKEGSITNSDESLETTIDRKVRTSWKIFKDQMKSTPTAYVNSNVQNVNDSIVFV